MAEKKVATRQERLMFEKIIQNDRQYPNIKEQPSNGSNDIMQRNTPQSQQYNKEQQYIPPYETNPSKKETPVLLRQPLVNRRNIGKRDAVWEAKRQRKMEMITEIAQKGGGQYENEAFPRDNRNITPQDPLLRRTPMNEGYEQKRTPMNNQDYSQQERQTPINQQQAMQMQGQGQGRTPISNQQQPLNRTPQNYNNIQGRTPMQSYPNQGNNLIINEQPNRTPMNQNNNYQHQDRTPFNNNQMNRTPMNNPPSQDYERRTPINQIMGNSQQQIGRVPLGYGSNDMYNLMGQSHSYQNKTPINSNQDMRATPSSQYPRDIQGKVHTPYQQQGDYSQSMQKTPMNNQFTSNKYSGQQQRDLQYYEQENKDKNYQMQRQQQYPSNRTPHQQYQSGTPQQYPPNRTPLQQYPSGTPQQYPPSRTPQYQNQNNIGQTPMRGSRTPFTDSQGNPSYKPSGSFYGQSNTPNLIINSNKSPSRPFDNVSFKDQYGGGYSREQNYYPNRNQQQPYY